MMTFGAAPVSACSTAWVEWSLPLTNLCVSTALTTWWATLTTAKVMPPNSTSTLM